MNGKVTVNIDFDRYLHLLEIEQNFISELESISKKNSDDKLGRDKSLYDQLKRENHIISMENSYKKTTIEDLKTINTNQIFAIQKIKHELESIKNKWYYKLFDDKRTL